MRRDTNANWTSNNPILLDGEVIIIYTDSGETRFKVGDGVNHYTDLPFITPVRGVDYWTAEDIAEIKAYVDDAILGGAW